MRVDRLDLIRYGALTDRSLVLAPADCDLQIVFGLNEAGKSTTLAALEELLFGIERFSPYSFLHGTTAMRIGGVVSQAGKRLEFRRRKGNRDTLLTPADGLLPGGEAALAPFLNGVTRETLGRMFALTHERLRAGGQEMLEAKGDAGQALFSAGTGLADLRQRTHTLEQAADELWAPRASVTRAWYVAKNAMDAATKKERECTMTAAKLQEATRTRKKAQDECARLEAARATAQLEQHRLARIRRVYRNVHSLAAVEGELTDLGQVIAFPDGADANLTQALLARGQAQARIDTLTEQTAAAKQERNRLVGNEDLLARALDVANLQKQRIEVRKEQEDLPQRRTELKEAEGRLMGEAEQLGWKEAVPDDIIRRIPAKGLVAAATKFATQRGALEGAVTGARDALADAAAGLADHQSELAALPPAHDVTALAALLATIKSIGDPVAQGDIAEQEIADAQADIDRCLATLDPGVDGAERLTALPMPPVDTLRTMRDRFRDAKQETREAASLVAAKERQLAAMQAKLQRRVDDEHVVTRDMLDRARAARAAGWQFVRARYIDRIKVDDAAVAAFQGEAVDLPQAFEQKTGVADTMADQRFDTAEAAGELAALGGQLGDGKIDLDKLKDGRDAADKALASLQQAWTALWTPCGITPSDADAMLHWVDVRGDVVTALRRRETAERARDAANRNAAATRASLLDELRRVAPDYAELEGKSLRVLVELASTMHREHERRAEQKRATEVQIRKETADVGRKRAAVDKATGALQSWQEQWDATLTELRLHAGTVTEAALAMFDRISTMRGLAATITDLRIERIAKMEHDITGFETSVAAFVKNVSSDLTGLDPGEAVVQLEQRLASARKTKTAQDAADKQRDDLARRLQEADGAFRDADRVVSDLLQLAGSTDVDQLKVAMQRAAHAFELRRQKIELAKTIVADGDGHTLDELRAECTDIDLDATAAREQELAVEIQVIEDQLKPAVEARIGAEQALNAIGEGDAAAQAAAAREEALTDMRRAAERYVRARTAVVMLQWAIDRYQREKQAPLLRRATTLFAALTDGSFAGVKAEFDDKDQAKLVGVRPNEFVVDVAGMSEGTADQLYLALRLAAIYEHLEHSPPMPVIADDLLVNFDNVRATAALKVLGELARHTQVIFFTHHRHLVDIAIATLGADAHIAAWTGAN